MLNCKGSLNCKVMVKDTDFVNIYFVLMKRQANKMLVLNEVIIIYSNVCLKYCGEHLVIRPFYSALRILLKKKNIIFGTLK